MKKSRSVSEVLFGQMVDMGGLPIRQPFPTSRIQQIDPFLLLHHFNGKVPTHVEPDHAGVGPHPHRGFSPVTFIFKGGVHHRDSRGNDSTIYEGVQWMNAGMGIIHSERPPFDIHERGGRQEIIQLWINTPSAHKLDQPAYYPLPIDRITKVQADDGRIVVNVVAGELLGGMGSVPTYSPVNAATIEAKKNGKIFIPIPPDHSAFIYLLDGKLKIDDYGLIDPLNVANFNRDGEGVGFEALEDTRVLLLSGEPLNEKVVSHGPFVMNSETQILEAMRDYQMGKMGVLIED
ncbi:MAG TPA: pirin family protein [Cyclobacteriaceae bacterium]|nr:pirin family protein [Cyclobacteriaceae bacterium]